MLIKNLICAKASLEITRNILLQHHQYLLLFQILFLLDLLPDFGHFLLNLLNRRLRHGFPLVVEPWVMLELLDTQTLVGLVARQSGEYAFEVLI